MVPPAEIFPYVLCEGSLKCNLGLLLSEMLVLEANLTAGSQTVMKIRDHKEGKEIFLSNAV